MQLKKTLIICLLCIVGNNLFAQKDSTIKLTADTGLVKKQKIHIFKIDTSKPYTPKYAILRSAIIPGWGQATNKKYWKIPIVYGALVTTAAIFFHNIKQFNESNLAYKYAISGDTNLYKLIPQPYYSVLQYPQLIQSYRNSVRQNVDYSVLFFIAFWGLNVVDATVDAHLKTFDVSDKLSFKIKPGHSYLANTNGISLMLDIHRKQIKPSKNLSLINDVASLK